MNESKKLIATKRCPPNRMNTLKNLNGKQIALGVFSSFFLLIIYEAFFVNPEDRLLPPNFADKFLMWVESNPGWGLIAIAFVIAAAVVTLIPIGTPLTIGCGYIYRGVYGWRIGLLVSTLISMLGSCLGAVICFLLGRYLMRSSVKQWARKYPLFDAIDTAAKDQGLKIMAMLYLTPVMPLGVISYMCGTTSMNIYSFAFAKVFAFPLYLVQTFIGASAHALVRRGDSGSNTKLEDGGSSEANLNEMEENGYVIGGSLLLSLLMVTLVTRHIRKELTKILDAQKKEGVLDEEGNPGGLSGESNDPSIELGVTTRRRGVKSDAPDSSGLPTIGDRIA